MTKWEYCVTEPYINGSEYTENRDLDVMGKDGWELVSVRVDEKGGIVHYHKRPLPSSLAKGES